MSLLLLIAAFILFPGAAFGEITYDREYQPPIRDWTLRHYTGATFYVDDDTCPEEGNGTYEDPYCAIQDGIDAAGLSGDLVIVAAGTYVENLHIDYKGIQIQSEAGPELTIIDGGLIGTVIAFEGNASSGSLIDGFTLQYGFTAGEGGAIFCDLHADPTIMNCTITYNFASDGGGLRCQRNSSPKIIDSIFSENTATILGGAISCYKDSHAKVTNCIITDNTAMLGGGITCTMSSRPKITHTTITSNMAFDRGGGLASYMQADAVITNSVLWNNTAPLGSQLFPEYSDPDVLYSDIQGGWEGEGNIDEDPLFLGTADHHLSEGSPCIDTGTNAEIYTDMDGDTRPLLAGFDMGADEYTGSCWDLDGDGYLDVQCGEIDCNDADPLVNPGALEVQDDGFDNDCDGFTDEPAYGDIAPLGERDERTIAPDTALMTNGILHKFLLTLDDTELLDVAPFVICDESSFPVLISPAPDSALNSMDIAVILQAASGYVNLVPYCPE